MDADEREASQDESCDCKVGRLVAAYSLADLDDELLDRWLGEGGEKESLRDLESYVNRRVLGAAMDAADVDVLDGEVANVYRLLTADDASEGQRTETRNRLERSGVDVSAVEAAFVSHQTVHSHLRECLGASPDSGPGDPAERREQALDTIAALRSRTEAVAETTLRRLAGANALTPDEFDVIVDVSVTCGRCGRVHSVSELIRDGGCSCA